MESEKTLLEILNENCVERAGTTYIDGLRGIDYYVVQESSKEIINSHLENPLLRKCMLGYANIYRTTEEIIERDFGFKYHFGFGNPEFSEKEDDLYGNISELIPIRKYYGKNAFFRDAYIDLKYTAATCTLGILLSCLIGLSSQFAFESMKVFFPLSFFIFRMGNNKSRMDALISDSRQLNRFIFMAKINENKNFIFQES
ncbi:MAG: hypothetical protein NTV63_00210 [Candidatus Woesearchaeota archaeon]|nr:hypothetical protein [Candidatus Woesearchaeota archaeon]